jgi:hypothetical protein
MDEVRTMEMDGVGEDGELDVQLVGEAPFELVREDELDEAMFACCCSSTCCCCCVT